MTVEAKKMVATVTTGIAGFNGLVEKIDKLNRKAERHGMDRVEFAVLSECASDDGYEITVEITGCEPRIDGWELLGRIDYTNEIGIVVHSTPNNTADLSEYRDHDSSCDHCNSRRRRNDCYILADCNGRRKVVGRNCLADFVRNGDATAFVAYAEFQEWLAGIDNVGSDGSEGFGEYGGVATSVPVESFAAISALFIRKFGWTSRGVARETEGRTATADDVINHICNNHPQYKAFVESNDLYVSDDDTELARKALQWVESLTPAQLDKSEYLYTLSLIVTHGRVSMKNAGYAASIVSSYRREVERDNERKECEANAPTKVLIGKIGERLKNLVVTVKRVRYFEGNYGVTTIVAMETTLPDGTVAPLTWFASGSKEFDEGADYNFTGTVKKHDPDNQYGLQTLCNRCRLTEV